MIPQTLYRVKPVFLQNINVCYSETIVNLAFFPLPQPFFHDIVIPEWRLCVQKLVWVSDSKKKMNYYFIFLRRET